MNLQQKYNALLAELKTINAKYADELMPEDVQQEVAQKMADAKALKAQIEQAAEMEALVEFDEKGTGRKTSPVGAPETTPAQVKDKAPVFRSFGEQLKAVQQGAGGDIKANNMLAQVAEDAKAQGLNEAVDSEGGALIQPNFSKQIMENAFAGGEVLKRVDKNSVTSPIMKIPAVDETSRADGYRSGGIRGYWRVEAGLMSKSNPTFRNINLELNSLYVLGYATEEMLKDVSFLGSWMMKHFSDEIIFKSEDAIVNGDGAGKPLGFMASKALVTVAKETSQTADTVVSENILKMHARMPIRLRKNAVWVYNQDVEPQVLGLRFNSTDPFPLYEPPKAGQDYGTILGRPAFPVEYMQTVGDKGDIGFVNFSEIAAIDQAAQAAQSMHVRFLYAEQAFRVTYRFDAQPKWASTLTPFKGSNTLSPFVALAARA